nr:outer membrane protein transport protein [Panacagrimonas sp.]
MRVLGGVAIQAAALAIWNAPAHASNNLNVIGFGVQSIGMGGADIPMSQSSEAVNINPAGLSQIGDRRFDYTLVPYYTGGGGHSDPLNGKSSPDNDFNPYYTGGGGHSDPLNGKSSPDNDFNALFNVGYAHRLNPSLVLGAGLFVQGGSGYQYKNLRTVFGTRDEYSAIFGVTKLALGAAYKVTDTFSVGANLGIAYSQARQKVFPDTSTADFSGLRFDGGKGVSANGRIGLLWLPTPDLRIGASYMSPTTLKLDDATLTVNQEAQGLGRVRYRDAEIKGFHLAREAGVGIGWRFQPGWLLAVEFNWLDWSDAMKSATLRARDPNKPGAPASLAIVSPLNHRDQYVWSIGMAIDLGEKAQLLVGWNHTRNAIPSETLSPAFNLTTENEADLGLIYKISPKWEVGAVIQYQFDHDITYDNPDQPFGAGAKEHYSLIGIDIGITRRW